MMRILFIHGGGDGAYTFDRDIVSRLSDALGTSASIDYPHIEGLEDIDWSKTEPQLTELLSSAVENAVVVAHSIGASATLKVFANGGSWATANAFLLAAPYKGVDSHWGVDEFTLPSDFDTQLPNALHLSMYHAEDDEIIPVTDAIAYREKLPAAKVSLLPTGGHQFAGSLSIVAKDIRSVLDG